MTRPLTDYCHNSRYHNDAAVTARDRKLRVPFRLPKNYEPTSTQCSRHESSRESLCPTDIGVEDQESHRPFYCSAEAHGQSRLAGSVNWTTGLNILWDYPQPKPSHTGLALPILANFHGNWATITEK